jgi:O-antigen ligase
MAGAFVMICIYCFQFFSGKPVKYSKAKTPAWLLLIVLLNFISFFYTQNYYYTNVAVLMNISALTIFYFTSIYTDNSKSLWILEAIVLSGIIISIVAWLQYYNSPILPQWLKSSAKTTALIGNSNYLGAYLLFPLLALSGLMFLLKGKMRFIIAGLILFVLIALLFSKTRSAMLGFSFALPIFLIFIKKIHRFSIKNYIKENPKQIIASTIIISCLFTTLWFVMPNHFYRDIKSRQNISTLIQRSQFFSASLELLKENPFFGTGLWSYRNGVYRAQARILETNPDFFKGDRANKPKRVHNEYLETLNDGGIVAAMILLFFILIIMGHGFKVIRDQEASRNTRVVASSVFSMIIAIMVNALFFFPFRINTTLFLTALTLGILEGLYLSQYNLSSKTQNRKILFAPVLACLVILMLIPVFWFRGIKPLKAEIEHFKYEKALYYKNVKKAEMHILKAISYDPDNTRYHVYAALMYMYNFRNYSKANEYIDKSLINFIGDNTLWGLYYIKGLARYHMGSFFEARELFQKSLYYNPNYEPSIQRLAELENLFKNHDQICIKLR